MDSSTPRGTIRTLLFNNYTSEVAHMYPPYAPTYNDADRLYWF